MRPFVLLALLITVTVAFNVFREPEEQFLSVRRMARDASSDSSDSDENNDKVTDGSGSGDTELRRVVRAVEEEGSGEASGFEVTSAPLRFIRSVDADGSEGSGSGDVADE